MSAAGRENEIKLPAADAETARRTLYRAGFRVHKRRRFEDNTMFDTPEMRLRKAAEAFRVREAGGKIVVTYKGRPDGGKHKSREEIEVEVSDASAISAIAARLGFEPVFRYQKYRTEYKQKSGGGVATLDETPIGVYLELEGPPAWVDRTARKLGYSEQDYITSSYGRLYLDWRDRHRSAPRDMLFR